MKEQVELIAQALDTIPEPTVRRTASAAFRNLMDAQATQPPPDAALKSMEQRLATMQDALKGLQLEWDSACRLLQRIDVRIEMMPQSLMVEEAKPKKPKPKASKTP